MIQEIEKLIYKRLNPVELRDIQLKHDRPLSEHSFLVLSEGGDLDTLDRYAGALRFSLEQVTGLSWNAVNVALSNVDEGTLISVIPQSVEILRQVVEESNKNYISRTNLPPIPQIPQE